MPICSNDNDKEWRIQSSRSCRRIFNKLEEPLTIKEIRCHRARCDIWNIPSDGFYSGSIEDFKKIKNKNRDREWYRKYGK